MARRVIIKYEVFEEICRYSSQFASSKIPREDWVECMGYLFCNVCKPEDKEYVVVESVGMTSGSEMRVEMPPDELAKIEKMLNDRPSLFLGGWWHTHPGLSLFYSSTDIQNQTFYQQGNEDGLGIVFDLDMITEKFIGFKIFRNDSRDAKTYHEVEYGLEGFTQEKLRKAFSYIGGIPDYLIHNLSVNYGFSNDSLIKTEDIQIPDVNDAIKEADNHFNKAKIAQFRKNFILAAKEMMIAAELYVRGNEKEMGLESYFDASKYAHMGDQSNLVSLIDDIVENLINSNPFLSTSYFNGKKCFIRALGYDSDANYSKAAELMKNAINNYDHEEDFEEIFDAYVFRSEFLEKMGNKHRVMSCLENGLIYLEKIIEDEDKEEYSDRDWNSIKFKLYERIKVLKAEVRKDGLSRVI